MSGLVEWMFGAAGSERLVPIHVNDQHIERDIVVAEAMHQVLELLVAVGPVARPPCAEGKARRQRDASGNFGVVGERLLVIVAVAKEIPVLAIACRTLHHPGPGTAFTA